MSPKIVKDSSENVRELDYVLGLASMDHAGVEEILIEPGKAGKTWATAQVMFKANRLIIPRDVAESFIILDFSIGRNQQFAGKYPVPCTSFAYDADDQRAINLKCDACNLGAMIQLHVRNIGKVPMVFRASLNGPGVESY